MKMSKVVYPERTPAIEFVVVIRYPSPKNQDGFPINDVGNDSEEKSHLMFPWKFKSLGDNFGSNALVGENFQ